MTKVIDAFLFYNEFDILNLRLNYLKNLDYFIICECNYTHSGNLKPYYLDKIIDDIPENIRNKIIRLKYEPSYYYDAWTLENEHRDFISKNLQDFSSNDIIMISDVDEIPKKSSIEKIFNLKNKDFVYTAKCDFFYYNFNTFLHNDWDGTTFCSVENCIKIGSQELRNQRSNYKKIEDGGWHFSYFGDIDQIKLKINSFAHQEFNKEEYVNNLNIEDAIKNKQNLYDKNWKFSEYDFKNYPNDLKELIVKIFSKEYYDII